MARDQFDDIANLIQQKRYSEARTLLEGIDNPKARKWLEKLYQIAPEPQITALPGIKQQIPEPPADAFYSMQELTRYYQIQIDQQAKQIKLLGHLNTGIVLLTIITILVLLGTLFSGTGLLTRLVPSPIAAGQQFETDVISCDSVKSASDEGWRVVAAYSYSTGSSTFGYTVFNDCVVERPR
ncbi:MAG: hypothetical protein ABI700_17600 [Chloroflexota bacterium]